MVKDLITPCCGATFYPHLGYEGTGYLEYQVVDGYLCNGVGCNNEWEQDGTADPWNKYPNETEAS